MKRTEIRRKVGELLGYRVGLTSLYGPGTWYALHDPQGEIVGGSLILPEEPKVWQDLPRFDRDIAEAWRVVGFMQKQDVGTLGLFVWRFIRANLWSFTAEEAALEICLLALRAAGVEAGEVEEDGE